MKNLSFVLFLFTLVFAPLAFGTTEEWSLVTVEIMVCLSAVIYLASQQARRKEILTIPGLLPLMLLLAWMVLQIIPLPVTLVKFVSPAAYEVYRPVIELSGTTFLPLSVNQKGTVNELLRIGAYTLFFLLTVQLLSDEKKLQLTIKIVVWLAFFVALLTILQKLSSPYKMYWFRPGPEESLGVTGPWVARSQFCGFMELLCPLALGLFFYYKPRVIYNETLRMRIVSFLTMPGSNFHLMLGTGLILIVTSVFISLSRGGIISLCMIIALFFLFQAHLRKDKNLFLLISLVVLIISVVSWLGWQPVINRFSGLFTISGVMKEGRLELWGDVLQMIRDYFFVGSGFGTFIYAYPSYKTLAGDKIYDHAHNEYLELLTDGGIVGFFLAAWFVGAILYSGWKMVKKRRDNYSVLMTTAGICGVLGMLIHCVTDFNMHNGADGLYFFFLCGLIVCTGHTRIHYRSRATLLEKIKPTTKKWFLLFGAVVFAVTVLVKGGQTMAYLRYNNVSHYDLDKPIKRTNLKRIHKAVTDAAFYDPLEGLYPAVAGTVEMYLHNYDMSLRHFLRAAELNPLRGSFLQRIGLILSRVDKKDGGKIIEYGYQRELLKDSYILFLTRWYLNNDKRDKALLLLKERVVGNFQLLEDITHDLGKHFVTRTEMAEVLPSTPQAWSDFGHHILLEFRNTDEALYYYHGALRMLEQSETFQPKPEYFQRIYNVYHDKKQMSRAIDVIRKGVQYLPDHVRFRFILGDYYLEKGIYYRAEEEYKHALMLRPDEPYTKRKLAELKEKMIE